MNRSASLLAVVLSACTTKIPIVEPEQFACDSDAPLASGELQCPESHWCDEGVCRPRLGCTEEGTSQPGCDRGAQRRCDPVLNELTTAVVCEGGNHTITSTAPLDNQCGCPDQGSAGTPLFCAHIAEGPSGKYPLFLTAPGEALPSGQFGITGDALELRWCVRVCATEADCPASHTCRPAPVITADLRAEPSSRHTLGACYPNLLVASSSTVELPQPDEDACLTNEDCVGDCRYRIESVADHPTLPIGAAWEGHRALVASCVPASGNLAEPGVGCDGDAGCKSGLCEGGKCQRPCNPVYDSACDSCAEVELEREANGGSVFDRVHVCSF